MGGNQAAVRPTAGLGGDQAMVGLGAYRIALPATARAAADRAAANAEATAVLGTDFAKAGWVLEVPAPQAAAPMVGPFGYHLMMPVYAHGFPSDYPQPVAHHLQRRPPSLRTNAGPL